MVVAADVDDRFVMPGGRVSETVSSQQCVQDIGDILVCSEQLANAFVQSLGVNTKSIFQYPRFQLQSKERAMAVVAMIGWAKDCDPYPLSEVLVKYRAVMEGMPEYEFDGSPSDPKESLGEANYRYLMAWHTKRMSSTRGDFAGVKGIRGYFASHEKWNFELCKDDVELAEMKAKAQELMKGGYLCALLYFWGAATSCPKLCHR